MGLRYPRPMRPPSRLLVLHDRPDDLLPLLRRRAPDLAVEVAPCPAEVAPALARFEPDAVLSIKHTGFPGPAHRPALRHPSVRWFHVGGSGTDHLGAWEPARVSVTNSAGVLAPFLAEMAMAAMLSLALGLPRLGRQQAARVWRPRRFRPLAGRTLLVVGVGHVGGAVAERAAALGLRVVGVRASGAPHAAVSQMHRPPALLELLPHADIVSLHLRLTAQTRGLLGAPALSAMKRGALLLNSARGALVDEAALLQALVSGHLGGAWLDVFSTEPLPDHHPLWRAPNTLITPHCADQVEDFAARFAERFCDLRDGLAEGRPLPSLRPPPAARP